jgi:ABC-type nickel/cobalt efflux system permease component RcnA
MKSLGHYLIVWYANNFATPFWMIGHYHFATNNYEQDKQLLGMISINLITIFGIYLDWRMQKREAELEIREDSQEELAYFAVAKTEGQGKPQHPGDINDRIEFGMKNRKLNLSEVLFVREDETYIYVHYKKLKQ